MMTGTVWGQDAGAQNKDTPATPSAANRAAPVVAERADRLLKQMSDYIGSAEQFTFHADVSFDHVLPSGRSYNTPRPRTSPWSGGAGFYVEWHSDLGDRQFRDDGKSITLYDPAVPFYAAEVVLSRSTACWTSCFPADRFCPASRRISSITTRTEKCLGSYNMGSISA